MKLEVNSLYVLKDKTVTTLNNVFNDNDAVVEE